MPPLLFIFFMCLCPRKRSADLDLDGRERTAMPPLLFIFMCLCLCLCLCLWWEGGSGAVGARGRTHKIRLRRPLTLAALRRPQCFLPRESRRLGWMIHQ